MKQSPISLNDYPSTSHRLYNTCRNAISRCYNKNVSDYKYYGGRGITVQESWKNNVRAFCEYLETLPNAGEPGYTLDRIDNDKGYEEGNLRFATRSEQNLNKRESKTPKHNTSGVKGVSWSKAKSRWRVQSKGKHLGYFKYFLEAVFARAAVEKLDV